MAWPEKSKIWRTQKIDGKSSRQYVEDFASTIMGWDDVDDANADMDAFLEMLFHHIEQAYRAGYNSR